MFDYLIDTLTTCPASFVMFFAGLQAGFVLAFLLVLLVITMLWLLRRPQKRGRRKAT